MSVDLLWAERGLEDAARCFVLERESCEAVEMLHRAALAYARALASEKEMLVEDGERACG